MVARGAGIPQRRVEPVVIAMKDCSRVHSCIAIFKKVVHALRFENNAVVLKNVRGVAGNKGGRAHAVLPVDGDNNIVMKPRIMASKVLWVREHVRVWSARGRVRASAKEESRRWGQGKCVEGAKKLGETAPS
jgi:hypothetical protein